MTKSEAKRVAKAIAANCNAYHLSKVDHAEFSRVARSLWSQVDMGEHNIIGSACNARMSQVQTELNRIL